jgi:hypothetical protein
METLVSASKKTCNFCGFDKKTSKIRLSKFLKLRSLQMVNDCFKNESNAIFDVFLQRLIRKTNGVDIDRLHATIQEINENPSITVFKFRATNQRVNVEQNPSKNQLPQGRAPE